MANYLLQKNDNHIMGRSKHIIWNDYLYVIHSDDNESWCIIKYDQKFNKIKTITFEHTYMEIAILYIYNDYLYIGFAYGYISIIDKNDNILNYMDTKLVYIYDLCISNNYIFIAVEGNFISIFTLDGKFYKNIPCNDWVDKLIVIDNYLYAGDCNGFIYKISTINFQIIKSIKQYTDAITSIIYINNHLYLGGYDNIITECNLDLTIHKKIITLYSTITKIYYYNNQLFITSISGSLTKLDLNTYGCTELIKPNKYNYYLINWNNKLHVINLTKQYIKIYGDFHLRDYENLPHKTKESLWEAAKVFYMYNVSKDIRLLIYRQLLKNI
jgi:hypothetical protein